MGFPAPSDRQARILWMALTGLAIGVMVALIGLLGWSTGWLLHKLSPVLLPIAAAAIMAYLLDPVVDFFEKRNIPRTRAILLVLFLAVMLVLIFLAAVVPRLIVEVKDLVDQFPQHLKTLQGNLGEWLAKTPLGTQAKSAWEAQSGQIAETLATKVLPVVSSWLLDRLQRVASWGGLIAGFALAPVYLFYFLLEKKRIKGSWTDYLPLAESKLKLEVVFVIKAINDCLIVFFRGQVLVALCVGLLLTVAFLSIGLNYAVLLGMMAGVLGIIPYLGVMISLAPALVLATIQFGWTGPVMVLVIVGLVQMAEGLFISPKIIGDRVGLHPVTIIVAVMVGTTLLGGVLGGVLAIPLTAALRTLMFRYVWKAK